MGDSITIPRSYAGSFGVADVLPSVRRHVIPLPLLNSQAPTTGFIWGGDNATTGFSFFERNVTAERLHAVCYCSTTYGRGSTMCVLSLLRNASTVFSLPVYHNATTAPALRQANDTTARLTSVISSTDILRLYFANTSNRVLRLGVTLTVKEALDS